MSEDTCIQLAKEALREFRGILNRHSADKATAATAAHTLALFLIDSLVQSGCGTVGEQLQWLRDGLDAMREDRAEESN